MDELRKTIRKYLDDRTTELNAAGDGYYTASSMAKAEIETLLSDMIFDEYMEMLKNHK